MTSRQTLDMISWIPRSKIRACDIFQFDQIKLNAQQGHKPDDKERKFLNEIYRYTQGGGDKQDQPFKQYRRATSRGI